MNSAARLPIIIASAHAYGIQLLNTRFWQHQGRRIVGRKIGFTAKTVPRQRQLVVWTPFSHILRG
jgi:2-keto-4-pentenoate hydratase